MRRENENLSDYLLRIHEEELGYEYRSEEVQARVLVRKYKEFIKVLNLHDDMTEEEEKLFREFVRTNETLKSFYKKGSGHSKQQKNYKGCIISLIVITKMNYILAMLRKQIAFDQKKHRFI